MASMAPRMSATSTEKKSASVGFSFSRLLTGTRNRRLSTISNRPSDPAPSRQEKQKNFQGSDEEEDTSREEEKLAETCEVEIFDRLGAEVNDVNVVARPCGWSVMCTVPGLEHAGEGWLDSSNHIVIDGSARVLQEAVAIVVLIEPHFYEHACELLAHLQRTRQSLPPIVAVLVDVCAPPQNVSALLDVQQRLVASGADEVIWKMGGEVEAKVAISLAVGRVKLHRLESMREHEVAVEKDMRGLFWQAIPRIFEGFPPLCLDLPMTAAVGGFVGHSQLEAVLGQGTSGIVYAAKHADTGVPEAIKVVRKDAMSVLEQVNGLWQEVLALERLDHPNIVALLDVFQGPRHIFLVMERAGEHNLFQFLKQNSSFLPERTAGRFYAKIMDAMQYCHVQRVAHRDLKPENIIVSDCGSDVKLLDFGSAITATKSCSDIVGTMPFLAPEVMKASNACPYMACGADIWSSGVLLLEMICGLGIMERLMGWRSMPTPCKRVGREVELSLADEVTITKALLAKREDPEDGLVNLMIGVLQVDVARRYSAAQAVRNQWLKRHFDD